MQKKILLSALLASGISFLGSMNGWADPSVTSDKIAFGQAAALEGPAAALGTGMRTGLLAAFKEINKAGGIHGRKLELISKDDSNEPNKSIEATNQLIEQDKVFALIGPVGTPTSSATQPIATTAGVPFIGPEFLCNPFKPNVANVGASYYQETEAMVERLTKTAISPASPYSIRMTDLGVPALKAFKRRLRSVV